MICVNVYVISWEARLHKMSDFHVRSAPVPKGIIRICDRSGIACATVWKQKLRHLWILWEEQKDSGERWGSPIAEPENLIQFAYLSYLRYFVQVTQSHTYLFNGHYSYCGFIWYILYDFVPNIAAVSSRYLYQLRYHRSSVASLVSLDSPACCVDFCCGELMWVAAHQNQMLCAAPCMLLTTDALLSSNYIELFEVQLILQHIAAAVGSCSSKGGWGALARGVGSIWGTCFHRMTMREVLEFIRESVPVQTVYIVSSWILEFFFSILLNSVLTEQEVTCHDKSTRAFFGVVPVTSRIRFETFGRRNPRNRQSLPNRAVERVESVEDLCDDSDDSDVSDFGCPRSCAWPMEGERTLRRSVSARSHALQGTFQGKWWVKSAKYVEMCWNGFGRFWLCVFKNHKWSLALELWLALRWMLRIWTWS